jgi:hypothetical protein
MLSIHREIAVPFSAEHPGEEDRRIITLAGNEAFLIYLAESPSLKLPGWPSAFDTNHSTAPSQGLSERLVDSGGDLDR